jgi:hypothetical protein
MREDSSYSPCYYDRCNNWDASVITGGSASTAAAITLLLTSAVAAILLR